LAPRILLLLAGPLPTALLLARFLIGVLALLAGILALLAGVLVLTAHSGVSHFERRNQPIPEPGMRFLKSPVPLGHSMAAMCHRHGNGTPPSKRYQRRLDKPAFAAPHAVAARGSDLLGIIATRRPKVSFRHRAVAALRTRIGGPDIGGSWIISFSSSSTASFSARSMA
jgi:hypothetical protein